MHYIASNIPPDKRSEYDQRTGSGYLRYGQRLVNGINGILYCWALGLWSLQTKSDGNKGDILYIACAINFTYISSNYVGRYSHCAPVLPTHFAKTCVWGDFLF